jgi:hypothetical protein
MSKYVKHKNKNKNKKHKTVTLLVTCYVKKKHSSIVFLREKEIHSFFSHYYSIFHNYNYNYYKIQTSFSFVERKGICNLSTHHHTISKIIEMSDYFITLFFIY